MYNEDDERPVGQRLRVVELLDVSPGRAQDPNEGLPIAILTILFQGELDQPMMFRMRDVRRLAIGFLSVVAQYDGGLAEEILSKHFLHEDGSPRFTALDPCKSEPAVTEPATTEPPVVGYKLIISYTATMNFRDPKITPVELGLIAGYRHGQRTLLACECRDLGEPVISLALLGPRRSLTMLASVDTAVITAATRMATTSIDVEGQTFRRLTIPEFRRVVGTKEFTFQPPRIPKKRS